MAQPATRQELIDYALRKLGAPVTQINVAEEQIDDRVDDAIQLWNEFHFDASRRTYIVHEVTASDVSNEYIPVPDTVQYIKRILPIRSRSSSSASMFDIRYQIHLNDLFDLAYAGQMAHFYQTKQYIGLLEQIIHGQDEFEFSRFEDRLYLPSLKWGTHLKAGDYVTLEAWIITDPETYMEAYNDRWLKGHVTALIKRQWGANMKKFDNVQLPGGAILNGQQLYDEADAEVKDSQEQLRNEFEPPLGMIVG